MLPDDPRHGTYAGSIAHAISKTPTCEPCRTAGADYHRNRRARIYLAKGPLEVDATGTYRRIEALMALGWSLRTIAAEIDKHMAYPSKLLRTRTPTIHRSTALAIADAYDRLSMKIPPDSPYKTRNLRYAKRAGLAPPLAWDDSTIDDPEAKPAGMGPDANHALTRADELQHLAHIGETLEMACTKLGISRDLLWRWCRRNGHRDLYERLAQRPESLVPAMAADDPRHGTVNGYLNQGCRCDDCRAAGTADRMARKRRAAEKVAA
jgi:hypothetical protein